MISEIKKVFKEIEHSMLEGYSSYKEKYLMLYSCLDDKLKYYSFCLQDDTVNLKQNKDLIKNLHKIVIDYSNRFSYNKVNDISSIEFYIKFLKIIFNKQSEFNKNISYAINSRIDIQRIKENTKILAKEQELTKLIKLVISNFEELLL